MEVAGRAFSSNLAAMERAGYDTRPLLDGLGLDLEAVQAPGFRGTWESYLALIERFHARHGEDAFVRCAAIQTTLVPETHAIAGLLVTPGQLLRFLMRRAESMFFAVKIVLEATEGADVQRWLVCIRPEHRASISFMVGTRAVLSVFPRFLSLPDAAVDAAYDPRATRYTVRLPSARRSAVALAELGASPAGGMLVSALEAGERAVRDLYDRIRAASSNTGTELTGAGPGTAPWCLTRRQLEVATWLVQGRANKEIAVSLGCSVRTVEAHVAAVLRKAGVASRAELVAAWHAAVHARTSSPR